MRCVTAVLYRAVLCNGCAVLCCVTAVLCCRQVRTPSNTRVSSHSPPLPSTTPAISSPTVPAASSGGVDDVTLTLESVTVAPDNTKELEEEQQEPPVHTDDVTDTANSNSTSASTSNSMDVARRNESLALLTESKEVEEREALKAAKMSSLFGD